MVLLNISRIFLKYGHFSYDRVNDQHMFTKQRFIAYSQKKILEIFNRFTKDSCYFTNNARAKVTILKSIL
jgi:hypothetical protein